MALKRNGKKCLSEREVEEAFNTTAERNGKRCEYCDKRKRWKRKDLVLHHRDNNPENNPKDGSNWAIACRSHNARLNPRGLGKFNPRRALRIEDLRTSRPSTEEMRRNKVAKPLFIEYFTLCIDEDGFVNIDDICGYVSRESAKLIPGGVVTATVERYCDDMVRGNSPYYIDENENCIRAHPMNAEPNAGNIEPES